MSVENFPYFPFLSVFRVRSNSTIIQDMPKTKNILNDENQNKKLGRCIAKKEKRQQIVITLTLTLPWSLSCSRIMSTSSIVQS